MNITDELHQKIENVLNNVKLGEKKMPAKDDPQDMSAVKRATLKRKAMIKAGGTGYSPDIIKLARRKMG